MSSSYTLASHSERDYEIHYEQQKFCGSSRWSPSTPSYLLVVMSSVQVFREVCLFCIRLWWVGTLRDQFLRGNTYQERNIFILEKFCWSSEDATSVVMEAPFMLHSRSFHLSHEGYGHSPRRRMSLIGQHSPLPKHSISAFCS